MNKIRANELRKDPEKYQEFLKKNRERRRMQMNTPGYWIYENREKRLETSREYNKAHRYELQKKHQTEYYASKEEYNYSLKQKKACRELANYTCQICGASKENGARIEAHHILPMKKGGNNNHELSNLICVCKKCHCDIHKRLKDGE